MNICDFKRKKERHEKISMLTCYDYPSARIIAETAIDCVLVGDSVSMVVHGYDSTIMATMDMMVMHTEAVSRGLTQQLIVSDLPFLCHRSSQAETISNVRRLLRAGAKAIKIEGGDSDTCQTIAYLVAAGVPIIGHIGLTPQSILTIGGYKVQGKEKSGADDLLQKAKQLEAAGCSALVIECVPLSLAKTITDSLTIPTIGIGAGVVTDGQVLVWHDMLGLHDFKSKFLKQYAQCQQTMLTAITAYDKQVKNALFPAVEHAY